MKILFISHQASKSGASIALLNFLKWMTKSQDHKIRIIIIKSGELTREFKQCGKTFVLERKWNGKIEMMKLGFNDLFPRIRQFINGIKVMFFTGFYSPEVIYVNSVTSLKALPFVRNVKKAKVICHVHELEYAFSLILSKPEFVRISKYIDRYIAPSVIAKKNLAENYYINNDYIDVVPEQIYNAKAVEPKKKILDELRIKEDTFIVMGSGITSWLKAPEIFIMIANEVTRLTKHKVKFIWLGELYMPYYRGLLHDIKKMGLSEKVDFIGLVDKINNYLQLADVFLLTSREDTYPLICLEAASQGAPVICFEQAGGMPEFVRDDAGFVVPYMDTHAAAEKIVELMNDRELKEKLGKKAQQRVREESDINVTGQKIMDCIEKLMNEKVNQKS